MKVFKIANHETKWKNAERIMSKTFVCCNCGKEISSNQGYLGFNSLNDKEYSHIYICHNCCTPNVFDVLGNPLVEPKIGKEIANLPKNISNLYNEVRSCLQGGSFTAAAMLMRRMLMDIAVSEGIDENLTFAQYVDKLCSEGIVPKKAKHLADSVRKLGNEVTHKLEEAKPEETYALFKFMEMLLEVNYEFSGYESKDSKNNK